MSSYEEFTQILEKLEGGAVDLQNIPVGFVSSNNEFFQKRNRLICIPYKKLGVISSDLNDFVETKEMETTITNAHNVDETSSAEIYCNTERCGHYFKDVASYQAHYNSLHRFICSECKKSLPTNHLLDLHLTEQHDSFFAARVNRGDSVFVCYVEECPEHFCSASERKDHCIKMHNFPSNYRFGQLPPAKNNNNCINNNNNNCKDTNTAKLNDSKDSIKSESKAKPSNEKLKLEENTMDYDDSNVQNPFKFKCFTFGHQREKTFVTRNKRRNNLLPGETLESMDTLTEAINDIS